MRADQLDAALGQSLAKWVTVRRFVVNQTRRNFVEHGSIDQVLHQRDFSTAGALDIDGQRQAMPINEHHQFRAFAAPRLAYAITPFFAEAKVASAKDLRKLICPRKSSICVSRRQACSHTPSAVHSTKRRQQVGYEGNDWGRSRQRAPVRSTHTMPSTQQRGGTRGRPPSGFGSGSTNKSAMSCHCLSVSCGRGSVLDPAFVSRDRIVSDLLEMVTATHDAAPMFS
jgi:hypothetical protein